MALWTPADITTALWIDFADQSTLFDATSGGSVVTNGVGIARAEDKSGNGRNFTEGSSGNRPTWTSGVQNGLGIARYDGDDRLTSVAAASTWTFLHSTQSTIFVVVKSGTTSNPNAFYGWLGNGQASSANRGVNFGYDNRGVLTGLNNALNALCSDTNSVSAFSSVAAAGTNVRTDFRNILTANVFQISGLLCDPTNATLGNRLKIAVNGGSLVGNNDRNGGVSNNAPTFDLQIGSSGNNGALLIGDYCELIIAPSLLSTADRQNVEGYLAHKWGLTGSLPSDHPYKNNPPDDTFDPDAAAYITAVETADAATLPTHIKNAINDFVVGAKADGFWTAIKAACFLAGPATLNGALVPLVGPAPTNVGGLFVAGDYNQLTGLVGNGSNKYLNTNRNNNADGQNNRHLAVFATTRSSEASVTSYCGTAFFVGENQSSTQILSGVVASKISSRCADITTVTSTGNLHASTGLLGVSRSSSSNYTVRGSGISETIAQSSVLLGSGNLFIFARNLDGSPNLYANGRLAFYSIGESLNLAQLDARLTTYMAAIATPVIFPRRRRELLGGLL